ncbi:MAG: thioether cross-link-forming SCIFF peptide maturase [Candidatus Fimenecus sp.]
MVYQYKSHNDNLIVLDTCSGSVHVVDEAAFFAISKMNDGLEAEEVKTEILNHFTELYETDADELLADINELKKQHKLFSKDIYSDIAKVLKQKTKGIVKALCLHVAHTCNLNCEYCFASQGRYNGERALMSLDTAKRAIDFLVEHSGTRRNLEVDFFGGEPLLNWDVCKKTVEYARSIEKEKGKNFRFTLTTNGVLLDDEVTDFCNREMKNVVLSLDGRREVNDRFRVDYNGKGSFDRIVPNFQRFVERRGDKEYYMRGTFTHYNPDFLEDIKEMLQLGFMELSMEPVVCDPSAPSALTETDVKIVKKQYEELADLMTERRRAGKPFTFYHYILDLAHGPCVYKRISGCGSGTEYMAVTPSGELYPCHQFVSDKEYKLGDIWNGVDNDKLVEKFSACNAYSREECKDCWAKFYCSGGCAANALHASGKIEGVYPQFCELFKKRMECAIDMEVRHILEKQQTQ